MLSITIKKTQDAIDYIKSASTVKERADAVKYVSSNFFTYKLMHGQEKLEMGDAGQNVQVIQAILIGLGFLNEKQLSGILDVTTMNALKKFADKYKIVFDINAPIPDSLIQLFVKMEYGEGYNPYVQDVPKEAIEGNADWPPKPTNLKYLSVYNAEQMYGKIEWKRGSGDRIIILNDFKNNIITIDLPQLARIKNPVSTKIRCHKLAAQPILRLWDEWEKMGFLNKIQNWAGCFYPRTIRPKKNKNVPTNILSNHAFGVAFDINTISNARGKTPPFIGEKGCIRELVPIANKLGFFWGGHFTTRDGMHFELSDPNAFTRGGQYIV